MNWDVRMELEDMGYAVWLEINFGDKRLGTSFDVWDWDWE